MEHFVGIDVAKDRLDVHLRPSCEAFAGTSDGKGLAMLVKRFNACEGSRSSRSDPFAGVAQTLVQHGVPALIAMQFEITDQVAITFAEEFYAATADADPVDAALSAGRKVIFAAGTDIEWGSPVLYLRAPDEQLFSVSRDANAARRRRSSTGADGRLLGRRRVQKRGDTGT